MRLVIRNEGNDTAENVQVDVIKIFDDGESRKNFLPMPLLWTHLGREERNILQKQTVYLDIVNWNTEGNSLSSLTFIPELATRYGGGIDDFRKLKSGKSRLELTFYKRGGKSFSKKIEIEFDGHLLYDFRIEGQKWYWGSKKKMIT